MSEEYKTPGQRQREAEIALGKQKGLELELRAKAVMDARRARETKEALVEVKEPTLSIDVPDAESSDTIPIFTEEELRAIADKHGMKGLRAIADKYGVKGIAKEELVREILTEQLKRQAAA